MLPWRRVRAVDTFSPLWIQDPVGPGVTSTWPFSLVSYPCGARESSPLCEGGDPGSIPGWGTVRPRGVTEAYDAPNVVVEVRLLTGILRRRSSKRLSAVLVIRKVWVQLPPLALANESRPSDSWVVSLPATEDAPVQIRLDALTSGCGKVWLNPPGSEPGERRFKSGHPDSTSVL